MTPNLSHFKTRIADYPQCETLSAYWVTDAAAVAAILPKPLEPIAMPLVMGFVSRFPEVSFGTPYLMGGLFVFCTYRDEFGSYVPSIVETDDFPVFIGREVLGYPKKMGELELDRTGARARALVERRGIRLLEIAADLGAPPSSAAAKQALDAFGHREPPPAGGIPDVEGINFLFKFSHSAELGKLFEHRPRIVRQGTTMRTRSSEIGDFNISLGASPSDSPYARLPVREKLFARYTVSHNTMNPPTIVGEIEDEATFLPHSYVRYES